MTVIQEIVESLDQFKAAHTAELNEMKSAVLTLEKKAGRPKADGGRSEDTPEQAEYRKAFRAYVRRGNDAGLAEAAKAMNSGSDPDGGYLVLPEMDKQIDRVAETMGGLVRVANTVRIGTQKYEKLVKTSGMAMRRVANGGTGGETTEPKYSKVEIEVFPAEAEPWVYNETLQDSFIDLESDLADEAAIAFGEGAGAEVITGNGVGCARGILSYPAVPNASYAWGSVGYICSGKSAAFMSVAPADRLIQLQHSLMAKYRSGASWLMNSATAGVMRQMKDGSGSYYLWQDGLLAGQPPVLLGAPVIVDDNMPSLGAGSFSVAYGNFKRGYTIVNHAAGTTLIRDNVTSKGQTKFNFRRRFGGGVVHYEAIKLLKFATS